MSQMKHHTISSGEGDDSFISSESSDPEEYSDDEIIDVTNKWYKHTLDEILVENSLCGNKSLIKRLFEANLLINRCSKCGLDPFWNGKKLSLQLDHINGVNNDNRIENLRILCPNCHSQTSTFTGKNTKKKVKKNIKDRDSYKDCACGKRIQKKAKQCRECSKQTRSNNMKVFNVSKNELENMLFKQHLTRVEIARKYNVTKGTVGNRCKEYGIPSARKY